jgi:hypothetical protein
LHFFMLGGTPSFGGVGAFSFLRLALVLVQGKPESDDEAVPGDTWSMFPLLSSVTISADT